MFKVIVATIFALLTTSLALEFKPIAPCECHQPLLVGDGSPHQNYLYRQVSENCDGCVPAQMKSTTFSWSADGGFSQFFSGGFSVSESETTGESHTCPNDSRGVACVWYKQAFTAYTVNHKTGPCPKCDYQESVVTSPNTNNNGGEYLCKMNDDCTHINDEYWIRDGPAGGPP